MQPWDGTFARRIVQRHQRITSAACLAALAAKGSAVRLAPRHYRIAGTRRRTPCRGATSCDNGGCDGVPRPPLPKCHLTESAFPRGGFDPTYSWCLDVGSFKL